MLTVQRHRLTQNKAMDCQALPGRFIDIRKIWRKKKWISSLIRSMRWQELCSEILPKKKDVTTNTLKNMIDDEAYITIMASISDCITHILEDNKITVDEFMELSRGDDANVENDFINEKYDDFNINGNFIEQYAGLIDPMTRTEIEVQVRMKIMQMW